MNHDQDAIRKAMLLAASPAGQKLLAKLQNCNSGQLQQAMESARAGNYGQAKQVLSGMMDDPEIRALLEQMGGSHGANGR